MKTCIIYVCNSGYLVPALVSAMAARRLTAADAADVAIFDVSPETAVGAFTAKAAAQAGVRYIRVEPKVLDGLHVAYGRLMADRFLPEEYTDFIYVDSDTQTVGAFDELARAPVPTGKILACRDPMCVMIGAGGKMAELSTAYINGLGLTGDAVRDYINTGLFKAERGAWDKVGQEAARLVKAGANHLHKDQDVINIVAHGSFEIVSFKWNFPGFFLKSGLEDVVKPRLLHYMSNPRPWQGPFHPWGPAGRRPYEELALAHPELAPYWPKLKPAKYLKYVAQQQYKRFTEAPIWAQPSYRDAMIRNEASVAV